MRSWRSLRGEGIESSSLKNNMAPSMVFRDGKPVLCQGAPGARRIMNRNVQIITNIVVSVEIVHYQHDPVSSACRRRRPYSRPRLTPVARIPLLTTVCRMRSWRSLRGEGIAPPAVPRRPIKLVEDQPGMPSNFARPSAIQIDYETELLRAGIDPFRPTTGRDSLALGY